MIKVKVLKAKTLGKINEINLDLVTSVNNEFIVGRSPQSGLILDSSDVSRMHGKFFVQNGNYYYSDLGSVNGSLVNDKLTEINQIYQLKSRDVIRIGEFLLVIEEIDEQPEAMPVTVFNANWQRASLKVNPPVITNQPLEPVGEVSTPADEHLEPVSEVSTPADEHLEPVGEVSTPADEHLEPVGEVSTPADQHLEPVSEVSTPADQHLEPVSEVSTPADQHLEPVSEVSTPADQHLEPVSEVSTPADQHLEPVSEVSAVVTNESEHLIPVDEELNQSPDLTIIQIPKEAIASEINPQTEEAAIASTEVETPRLSDIYESEPTVIQGEVTIIQLPEEVATEANTLTPGAIASTEVVETREIDSEIPSNTNESEATVIQGEITVPEEVATEENTPTPSAPASIEVVETTDDATVIHEDVTFIQLPQQVATEESTPTPSAPASIEVVEPTDDATVIHEDVTFIQLPQQVATEENTPTPSAPASIEVVEPTDDATVIHEDVTVLEQVATEENTPTPSAPASIEVVETTDDATVIHEEVTVIQIPEFVETEEIHAQTEEALALNEVQASENNTQTPLDINEVLEEVEASAVIPETTTLSTEVVEASAAIFDEVAPRDQPTTDTVSQTTMKSPESVTQAPEEVSQEITQASDSSEESEVMAQTPETVNKAFEIIGKKYIALMTHDSKKSELVQFVTRHQDFLLKCLTIATPSISETLSQQTSLTTSQKTPSVPVGGYQAVASLIGTGDVLAVILLKDFLAPQSNQANEEALLRLCNINQILVATNLPTADAIIHYIKDMVTSL